MKKSKANLGRSRRGRGNIVRIRRVKPKTEKRKTQSFHQQASNNFIISSKNKSKQPYTSLKDLCEKEKSKKKVENFANTLSRSLVALDSYLQAYRVLKGKNNVDRYLRTQKNLQNKELREVYETLIKKFQEFGGIEENVFYYAWCLNRKAVQIMKETDDTIYGSGENILLFSSCLYLSIKMLVDEETWFIEDFCLISGFEKKPIAQMEICLVADILGFNYFFSLDEIEREKKLIQGKYRKFRILKDNKLRKLRNYPSRYKKNKLEFGIEA